MQQFESLTKIGQIRRLKQLAETALSAYDLGETRLTSLMHFFNTTFRVDTCSTGATMPQRYVIRIHRPGSQDASTIRSELLWLLALRREANLVVPKPVARRDGGLVTLAASSGVPEPRNCVVLRWVDGRFHTSRLGINELERVGAFMGRLHRFSERFIPPPGFVRKRWDYEGIRNGVLGTDLEQSWAHLSSDDRKLLDTIGEQVQQVMTRLGEERDVFGLIHADFYERNYLFSRGEVHAIDFDGSGWGHYLFDIGVSFSTLLVRPNYSELRRAFLTGYRHERSLSGEHEALIDTFIAARLMCHVHWLAAHLDEPSYGERAARRIALELGQLRDLQPYMGGNRDTR